ncbi:MAG: hypothetical protein HQM10_11850 [Candidatus Riflebacteria bacterium]|nr:hypothetical protein [Candidatus Riflebacteria bacterium]
MSKKAIAGILFGIFLLMALLVLFVFDPKRYSGWSSIDFSILSSGDSEVPSQSSEVQEETYQPLGAPSEKEVSALYYLEAAWRDYYKCDYDEALRRLNRAKSFSMANYSIYRLSGQIYFETGKYRKAYSEWMQATALPNADKFLMRDIEVVKNLLRYVRDEYDITARKSYRNPDDLVAKYKTKELRQYMSEK